MKVVLEVTADGWSWTVLDGDKTVAKSVMVGCVGGARGTEKASVFEEALEAYPMLFEAIDEDGDPMSIMRALEMEDCGGPVAMDEEDTTKTLA